MSRVLVTPRSLTRAPGPELDRLAQAGLEVVLAPAGRQPSEEELVALVPGCVGWLAGVEPITRRVLDAATDLRVISRNGAGVDNVDAAAARERGVAVVRAGGANARGVAELAITLILSALRHVPATSAALRDGRWERALGREAAGLTLGVVGAGAIGREVLGLGAALGMATVASDVAPPADLAGAGVPFLTVDELLERADVVTLHCPPPEGRALLRDAELRRVRPGLVLVNTARAGLVDDGAVLAALEDGRLAAYATDVFDREPPAPSALLAHPAVIATPHVGGYTRESVTRAASAAVDNLLRILAPAERATS
jgi:D-3-phosphoglycerate dehydrogenase